MAEYAHHLELGKGIIEGFLEDRNFIEENAAIEITDPISAEAMIYPVKTPCNHYFNSPQIINWLEEENHDSCPACRCSPITTEQLTFSWEIQCKITKLIRCISKKLKENYLPPLLANGNIEEIKFQFNNLDAYSRDQINMINIHFIDAIRNARNKGLIDLTIFIMVCP